MALTLTCPVCGVRFRATRHCSRCGADLAPLMRLAEAAWHHRQAAREGLAGGDFARAAQRAAQAQALQRSPEGRRLEHLTAWLARHRAAEGG